MKLFSERRTPLENLTLIAMVSALDAILALILSFLPLSSLFIVIFLPLVSAFLAMLCKWQYLPLYIIVACAVSLIASLHDIGMVIFYVIPAILAGTLFGFLSKKGLPTALLIFFVAILELGINYLAIPIIKGLTDIDIIASFVSLFHLSEESRCIIPAILFLFSISEASLCALTGHFVFAKIPIDGVKEEHSLPQFIIPLAAIFFMTMTIIFAYIPVAEMAFLCLGASIYFSFMSVPNILKKQPIWVYVLLTILTAAGFIAASFAYRSAPSQTALCLYCLIFFGLDTLATFLKV